MKRLHELLRRMQGRGVKNLFITTLADIYYLTGFTGSTAYLYVGEDEIRFVTDGRYDSQSEEQVPAEVTRQIISDYAQVVKELAEQKKTVWVQASCPLALYSNLEQSGATVHIDADELVHVMRSVKDDGEIALIKEQYAVAGGAFLASLEGFVPGKTESEWAALLEYNMKLRGARSASFDTIIASGHRSCLPHGIASDKVVQAGDSVTVDFGSRLRYCSDITRQVYSGNDPKILEVISVVRDAMLSAINGVKAGVPCIDIDGIARGYIKHHGYGDYFTHGLGHGVGIVVHEDPRFNPRDRTVLEPNMVLTVEPGIYLPGKFGVRLEETVRVTENGCEILSAVLDKYVYNMGA